MNVYWLVPPALVVAFNYSAILKFIRGVPTNFNLYKEIYKNASFGTIAEFIHFKLRQAAAKNLETGLLVNKERTYELTYFNDSIKYTAIFPKKRGPCLFSCVTTKDSIGSDDVTEDVRTFAGPSHNFHGIETRPCMLGFENLTFTLRDGRILCFEKDQVISFGSGV